MPAPCVIGEPSQANRGDSKAPTCPREAVNYKMKQDLGIEDSLICMARCYWSIHAKPGNSLRSDSLLKAENVAAMRAGAGGHLTRRCVSSNFIVLRKRIPDPRPFFAQPAFNPKFMAQKADSQLIRSELEADGKEEKDSEKLPKEVPPPPEKPLPGDCCGSGCVRCVWDVYYEEVEEYNKLHKQNQTPKS